jgi:hypothetical protein
MQQRFISVFKSQLFKIDENGLLATRELPSVGCYGNYNISIHGCSDTYGGIFETHGTAALRR